VWGIGKLKNEFSSGFPKIGVFACDRLGIGRCEVVPGVPLMLRSPKLQKRASDPEGFKMGCSQNCTLPPIFLDSGSLAHGPKIGGAKKTHPM